jgi:hypothetical protein
MKSGCMAALAVLGASLAAASSCAATPVSLPLLGIIGAGQLPDFVQVASKKSEQARNRKKRKRYNDGFSYRELGIIPGHVPTPYGYRDCIGRWHLHDNGIIHCHGQLIRDY